MKEHGGYSLLAACLAVLLVIGTMAAVPAIAQDAPANPDNGADKAAAELQEKIVKLVKLLGDENFETRESAEKELTELGENAIPELAKALKDKDPEVCARAERILKCVQEPEEKKKAGLLKSGKVILQLRGGAGGGNPNQIFMHGKKSIYVRDLAESPLSFDGPIDISERSTAYRLGGYIPRGKVFIVRKITYWGTAAGDSNGHGEFKLVVGGQVICNVKDSEKDIKDTWAGNIVLKEDDEEKVYLEVANSSQGNVTMRGMIVDAKFADLEKIPDMTVKERAQADDLFRKLDSDSSEERDKAQNGLVKMGPAVISYLKNKKLAEASAEVKTRVKTILDWFGEDE